MELSLFDLHCDTAYEMMRQNQPLFSNSLAVSIEKAQVFRRYTQVMAFWTDHGLSDEEGWNAFLAMYRNLRNDPTFQNANTVFHSEKKNSSTIILGLEDARILASKLSRLDVLYRLGVRVITPLWKGETCIGGSHDTQVGLTAFGKHAVEKAIALGMIADISHASEASAYEMLEIARLQNRPIIASHSNAYDVCPVSRNLKKKQIRSVLESGGIIGLNLYPVFLNQSHKASIEAILPHLDYFLSMGAEDAICLGCDMDGADLPNEIQTLADMPRLAELLLCKRYSEDLIHKLFYQNAQTFWDRF